MTEPKSEFRGWKIPGPIPPGALGRGPDAAQGETLDALSGHFRIFQLEKGHRFSTDDILTAWYGTSFAPTVSTALDLGSGIGTVAMLAAWRLPGVRFVTVEAQAESVALARKSVEWNGLTDRVELRDGDLIWCWAARRIFRLERELKEIIRRKSRADSNCAGIFAIIAKLRQAKCAPVDCSPASFQ